MTKQRLIIDTDPGIDDALAISMALHADTLDVKMISTIAGNVGIENVTRNARKILKFFNKEHIPVAQGCVQPLIRKVADGAAIHGVTGMDGWESEEPTVPAVPEHAVVAMRNCIMESEEPTTLMPIGPLTNIALLLRMYPEVKDRIRQIVLMGGSLTRGNYDVMAEFNIAVDPEAAHIVFHSGVPLVVVPLDIGLKARIYPEDCEKLRTMNRLGAMAASMFAKYRSGSLAEGLSVYDPTALAYLLRPSLYKTQEVYGDVETNGTLTAGCTTIDLRGTWGKEPNMTVVTDVDPEAFREWFLEAIGHCQ